MRRPTQGIPQRSYNRRLRLSTYKATEERRPENGDNTRDIIWLTSARHSPVPFSLNTSNVGPTPEYPLANILGGCHLSKFTLP